MPNSESDWDYPLTDEDLRAIDSVISSAQPPKRHQLSFCHDEDDTSAHSPPRMRRRLPSSLFVFQQQRQRNTNMSPVPFSPCSSRSYYGRNNSPVSRFQGNCSSTILSFRFQPLSSFQELLLFLHFGQS